MEPPLRIAAKEVKSSCTPTTKNQAFDLSAANDSFHEAARKNREARCQSRGSWAAMAANSCEATVAARNQLRAPKEPRTKLSRARLSSNPSLHTITHVRRYGGA